MARHRLHKTGEVGEKKPSTSQQKRTVQQIWQECEVLSEELAASLSTKDFAASTGWSIVDLRRRKRLMDLIEGILLEDLSYALSKGAEQTLWTVCYKAFIEFLQSRLRQRKTETDSALLLEFLSSCLGSLSQLLTQICINYDLEVPGFRSQTSLGILTNHWPRDVSSGNQRASLKLILEKDGVNFAQFCLVHLGDIYRYQRHLVAAESSYLYAAIVAPSNGHPWNQLGILETARGEQVSATYFYTRALLVENAFLPAAGNLENYYAHLNALSTTTEALAASKNQENYGQLLLKFHARVHHYESLEGMKTDFKSVFDDFESVLSAGVLRLDRVLQAILIGFGSLWRISSEFSADFLSSGVAETEWMAFKLVCELVQSQLTGLAGFCSTKLADNKTAEDPLNTVLNDVLPVLNPVLQSVGAAPEIFRNAIMNGCSASDDAAGVSRRRSALFRNLTNLLDALEDVKEKNVRPWDCQRLKTLASFAGNECDETGGEGYWEKFWKEETPAPGLKTMPLPENIELKGFLPIEATAHKGLKFEEWPLDMVNESFVKERRLLMVIGRLRHIIGTACDKNDPVNNDEKNEDLIDGSKLKDWQWVMERLGEIIEESPVKIVEKPLLVKSSPNKLSKENGNKISENLTENAEKLTKITAEEKQSPSLTDNKKGERTSSSSPISVVRKTKCVPLIRILGRNSSDGAGISGVGAETSNNHNSKEDSETENSDGEEKDNNESVEKAKPDKNKEEKQNETAESEPPKTSEIAPAPKVTQTQQGTWPRQPLAPRFQAAKLKQALTGVRDNSPPITVADSFPSTNEQRATTGHVMHGDWPIMGPGAFPPLVGSEGNSGSGRRSAELFRPPTPLGGTTPDPMEYSRLPPFPRTPGTRFRTPPPFVGMQRFPGPFPPHPGPYYGPPRGPGAQPMEFQGGPRFEGGPRGMPHLRPGPPPGMVPPPGFHRSPPPPGSGMQGHPGPYGPMGSSQPTETMSRQWNRSPSMMMFPDAGDCPPTFGPHHQGPPGPLPNWENNVFFSKPNDPYFQLWQTGGMDSVAGNSGSHSGQIMQAGNPTQSRSGEIWGSGSGTALSGPSVFEATRRGIGIEHFPFTAPAPASVSRMMRPVSEIYISGNRNPSGGGFSLFGPSNQQRENPYPKWSENDGKENN